jgi:hypothetical protein
MVPWHLQPKYASECVKAPADGERAARIRADKKQEKRQRKRMLREAQHGASEAEGGGSSRRRFLGDGVEDKRLEVSDVELGPVQDNCVTATAEKCSPLDKSKPRKEVGIQPSLHNQTCSDCQLGSQTEQGKMGHLNLAERQQEIKAPGEELSQLGYTTFQRYYHVFQEGELAGLVRQVEGFHVQEEFYDHENWCVLAKKVASSCQ